MHIFITGGSGLTGPAVVSGLIAGGHTVTGLARSDGSAARLEALGAAVRRGSLEELDTLGEGAQAADGVIHMAFGGDFADPNDLIRRDRTAIETLGEALVETDKPFVATSGTFVMGAGVVSVETDAPDPESLAGFRVPGEEACLGFAERGVRSSVVRLSPTVHGPRDHGFIPMLIAAARRNGVSAYVGDGANRWPAIHRSDAATLFRLAVEKAPAGSVLYGAGESGVTLQAIAHLVGRKLGLPTVSLDLDEAAAHLGAPFFAAGVNSIDTALVHPADESEEILGKALPGGHRDEVLLARSTRDHKDGLRVRGLSQRRLRVPSLFRVDVADAAKVNLVAAAAPKSAMQPNWSITAPPAKVPKAAPTSASLAKRAAPEAPALGSTSVALGCKVERTKVICRPRRKTARANCVAEPGVTARTANPMTPTKPSTATRKPSPSALALPLRAREARFEPAAKAPSRIPTEG